MKGSGNELVHTGIFGFLQFVVCLAVCIGPKIALQLMRGMAAAAGANKREKGVQGCCMMSPVGR